MSIREENLLALSELYELESLETTLTQRLQVELSIKKLDPFLVHPRGRAGVDPELQSYCYRLLDFYNLAEIGSMIGLLPNPFPANFTIRTLKTIKLLLDKGVLSAGGMILPYMFFYRLKGTNQLQIDAGEKCNALYMQLLSHHGAYLDDEEFKAFVRVLVESPGPDILLGDFVRMLSDFESIDKDRVKTDRERKGETLHLYGFLKFLRFFDDFSEIFHEAQDVPVLRTALWYSYGLLFEIVRPRLERFDQSVAWLEFFHVMEGDINSAREFMASLRSTQSKIHDIVEYTPKQELLRDLPMRDSAQTVESIRESAILGLPEAQYTLGMCYAKGEVVPSDPAQAVAWYRKAAEQGHLQAQFNLAVIYDRGEVVPRDPAQAVAWYREAAEQGHPQAQVNLGWFYMQGGEGVLRDQKRAVAWYRRAAEKNEPQAQFNLGWAYETGAGVQRNLAEGMAWYQKAAEQGHREAQSNLGRVYDNGGDGIKQDKVKAVAWYRKAAELGVPDAQFYLGVVEQDPAKAVAWYREAAELGHAKAQFNLGASFERGEGVLQDETQAMVWYRKAAEQGLPQAKLALERISEKNFGFGNKKWRNTERQPNKPSRKPKSN